MAVVETLVSRLLLTDAAPEDDGPLATVAKGTCIHKQADDDDVTAAKRLATVGRPIVAIGKPSSTAAGRSLQSRWLRADSYRLDGFDQVQGCWPIGHPLPLPKWSSKQRDALVIDKVRPQCS